MVPQWHYVTLQRPFGGPQGASKTCRNDITQVIDSEAGYETTLAQVKERLTNHVTASHNLKWHATSAHVNKMQPQTWSEKALPPPAVLVSPMPQTPSTGDLVQTPTPMGPPLRYLKMSSPCNSTTKTTGKTCKKNLTEVVGASIDMAF